MVCIYTASKTAALYSQWPIRPPLAQNTHKHWAQKSEDPRTHMPTRPTPPRKTSHTPDAASVISFVGHLTLSEHHQRRVGKQRGFPHHFPSLSHSLAPPTYPPSFSVFHFSLRWTCTMMATLGKIYTNIPYYTHRLWYTYLIPHIYPECLTIDSREFVTDPKVQGASKSNGFQLASSSNLFCRKTIFLYQHFINYLIQQTSSA